MLQIALCDDDQNFLNTLAYLIDKFCKTETIPFKISIFTDGKKLTEIYKKQNNPFDMLFLDIDMPSVNGKDVARALRNIDSTFKLIFISSHENEVFNCFEYDVLDFIPKHLVNESLNKTLKRTVDVIQNKKAEYHFFETKGQYGKTEMIKVLLSDILYFESINRKVYLYVKKESYELAKYTWNQIEQKYSSYNFTIPHRGYLVNVKYIAGIHGTQIELDNGILIPIGRRNKKLVENMLLNMIE